METHDYVLGTESEGKEMGFEIQGSGVLFFTDESAYAGG